MVAAGALSWIHAVDGCGLALDDSGAWICRPGGERLRVPAGGFAVQLENVAGLALNVRA